MLYLAFTLAAGHGLITFILGPNLESTVLVLAVEGLIALGSFMDWAEEQYSHKNCKN